MDILWFESLDSTQSYLIEAFKNGNMQTPICVGTDMQTMGKGSRGNSWIGEKGNLFISVAIKRSMLPSDLKLESTSIYLAYLMKELMISLGSDVWLKWPNDFYRDDKKIGGVITNTLTDTVVCGIGINLKSSPDGFSMLDIQVSARDLTNAYTQLFQCLPSWKQIFSKYQLEFEQSRVFFTHHNDATIPLKDAVLLEDGSLECNGQRIYSLR